MRKNDELKAKLARADKLNCSFDQQLLDRLSQTKANSDMSA